MVTYRIYIDPKKKFTSFEMRFKRNAFPSFHSVTNLPRDTTGGMTLKYSKVLYITNSPFTRKKRAKIDVKGKYY